MKLLKNCYDAIPNDGKVIVVDAVHTMVPETTCAARVVAQGDVFMMTQNRGGKERSRDEFKALATKAGFEHINFHSCVYNLWVIELFKISQLEGWSIVLMLFAVCLMNKGLFFLEEIYYVSCDSQWRHLREMLLNLIWNYVIWMVKILKILKFVCS